MKADDCSVRCSAIAQFALNIDIPRLPRSRRHDMLHATYLRACSGASREDLCQILIKDIREAQRLDARPLAADLLVVLAIIVGECDHAACSASIVEITAFKPIREMQPIGGDRAA